MPQWHLVTVSMFPVVIVHLASKAITRLILVLKVASRTLFFSRLSPPSIPEWACDGWQWEPPRLRIPIIFSGDSFRVMLKLDRLLDQWPKKTCSTWLTWISNGIPNMVSIDKFWVFIVWENKIKWFAIPYLLLFLSKVRGDLEMLFIEKSICTFLGSRASSWTDSDDKCYKLKTFVQPGLISSSSIPHINRWKKFLLSNHLPDTIQEPREVLFSSFSWWRPLRVFLCASLLRCASGFHSVEFQGLTPARYNSSTWSYEITG